MVITVIPLFAKVNQGAWDYFHNHKEEISAITGDHLYVAIASTVLKGDAGDVYSAADSKRYPDLKITDLPCLWVESSAGHLTISLPSDQVQINKLLACITRAAQESDSWTPFTQKVEEYMDEQLPKQKSSGWSPIEILNQAIKAVPAMRYALAVLGLVAVVAIVAAWRIDFRVAIFGAVIVLVLMVCVLGFAKLARFEDKNFIKPMLVLLWAVVILTILVAFSLFTAAAFEFPPGLYKLLFNGHDKPPIVNPGTNPPIVIPSTNKDVIPVRNELGGEVKERMDYGNRLIKMVTDQAEKFTLASPDDQPQELQKYRVTCEQLRDLFPGIWSGYKVSALSDMPRTVNPFNDTTLDDIIAKYLKEKYGGTDTTGIESSYNANIANLKNVHYRFSTLMSGAFAVNQTFNTSPAGQQLEQQRQLQSLGDLKLACNQLKQTIDAISSSESVLSMCSNP